MNTKTSNMLLTLAGGALATGGLILLLLSILDETENHWALNPALAAVCLSNLLLLLRSQRQRKAEPKNTDGNESEKDHHA